MKYRTEEEVRRQLENLLSQADKASKLGLRQELGGYCLQEFLSEN